MTETSYQTNVEGSGAIAQGQGAKAVGAGGVLVEGDVGRDVNVQNVLNLVLQAGIRFPQTRILPAQLAALQQAWPHLVHPAEKTAVQKAVEGLQQAIADLPHHEQAYRERLKARYGEDAPYYVPLAGETSETGPLQTEATKQ